MWCFSEQRFGPISVSMAIRSSASYFTESKPQQTGIGLLIRHGEVATTSGSTNSLPGRLISRTPPFEGGRAGASPAPAASLRLGYGSASQLLNLRRPDTNSENSDQQRRRESRVAADLLENRT